MAAPEPSRLGVVTAPEKTPALHVEVVSEYKEFLNLKPAWDGLVEAAQITHPFLEHDWVRTWWDCFGDGRRLNIVLVKSGSRLVAIAPLILSEVRMWGIPIRTLGFCYNNHVPRADFIVSPAAEGAYQLIWAHLNQSRDWDLLQLCQLPEDSAALATIRTLASRDYSVGCWLSSISPYIPLEGSWEEFFGGLEKRFRANLKNRFKRIGPTEFVSSTVPDSETLDAVYALEAAAWKAEAGTAIACDSALRKFYTAFAERAAERGWLRLNLLRAGGKAIVADYTLEYRNRLFILKSGYDPVHAAFSPNNLLICRLVENAFERGLEKYDFLGDADDFKSRWSKCATRHFWLFVFSNTLKGRLLHALKFRAIPLLKKVRNRCAFRLGQV